MFGDLSQCPALPSSRETGGPPKRRQPMVGRDNSRDGTSMLRRRTADSRRAPRRLLSSLLAIALVAQGLIQTARAADRPTLYVFLQTDAKATVFEKTLQQKLPGLAVTVFGRFRDFEEAFGARRPDAVLALQPLLAAKGVQPSLRGVSKGEDFENYVLVSSGAALQGALSNRVIGVVDLLGRKDTQDFVARLLKTPDVKTKLVTKQEDLLSLLQFSAAEAIVLPASAVKTFTERSRLSLHVRELPDARVGRPAVAVLSVPALSTVLQQIQGLDRVTNEMIGVDGWRGR